MGCNYCWIPCRHPIGKYQYRNHDTVSLGSRHEREAKLITMFYFGNKIRVFHEKVGAHRAAREGKNRNQNGKQHVAIQTKDYIVDEREL